MCVKLIDYKTSADIGNRWWGKLSNKVYYVREFIWGTLTKIEKKCFCTELGLGSSTKRQTDKIPNEGRRRWSKNVWKKFRLVFLETLPLRRNYFLFGRIRWREFWTPSPENGGRSLILQTGIYYNSNKVFFNKVFLFSDDLRFVYLS